LFAPVQSAWAVLGEVQPPVAHQWGLPAQCKVHVGVHDSNACLARYLQDTSVQQSDRDLTIVSSGTWTVLMAPGASSNALKAQLDMLGNVDVTGQMTPTARFMGGREFATIANGAAPGAANVATLNSLIERSIFAMPSFAHQGGPFAQRAGDFEWGPGKPMGVAALVLDASERATLAAVYCAQMTAWLVNYLWPSPSPSHSTVIVEGPLADNSMYMTVLQALLKDSVCMRSTDDLEGTARGAWLLCRWEQQGFEPALQKAVPLQIDGLLTYHQKWLDAIDAY
jgi:sugar (pentulose or hexulose) kinase